MNIDISAISLEAARRCYYLARHAANNAEPLPLVPVIEDAIRQANHATRASRRALGRNNPVFLPAQIDAALQAVAEEYGITIDHLKSRCRDAPTSEARMWVLFLLRIINPGNARQIASSVGRNHSLVIQSCRKAIFWLRVYPDTRARYDRVAARFCQLWHPEKL